MIYHIILIVQYISKKKQQNLFPLEIVPRGHSTSIDISPRWGCPLVHPSFFFPELRLCEKPEEKHTNP